jgi:hypothetical protein
MYYVELTQRWEIKKEWDLGNSNHQFKITYYLLNKLRS